ncbi:uncharacterized protein LOC107359223 isoform X1 [Tetranychus urticae]|uniref:uncharacterized protein LOC107359223 isoform X1 n=1 Tax=Tetranychus urticae TaxID=32264 RepID=UPI00077BA6C4|nr:uncharacterized protein LOC107359223 isoform X1 [Tetranychus urticae]
MSESNYETSVKHDESLQLLSTRFISLLQDVKDGLLDLKMGSDILSVVLEGNSCNTREKTKILKLKEELQDLKNKEIEIAFNYASEKQEDECQDVGGKAQENDEAMEQGDSDDNNKSKVTSAQLTRQLPPRKAAQRHLCIQSRHHDNVKNKKTSIFNKKEASTKERPTIRGRVREKDKVSSESTVPASISRAKDDASLEEENEKKVSEKTSRDRIATLNRQNNDAKGQHTANRPVNSRVNTRANSQSKTPLEYHGQDSFGEHEESEVPYVTDTENLHITANKKAFPRGEKVYGCPYKCGFVCKPGRRFEVTRHLNSNIKNDKVRRPGCPVRRKMEVVCRDGTWTKSIKEPVFLGLTVTGRGGEKDKVSSESTARASIFRAKDDKEKHTMNKKLFPKGRKVYGCPYECGFVCKPGMRYTVTRHLNSAVIFGNLKKPSCLERRKMEVVCRDGTWPKSVKEPVFLGTAVTGSGREEYKAAISRAKSESLAEENGKKVPEKTKTRSRGRISTLNQKNNETRSQDTENHPVKSRMKRLASYQDKAFLEYPDLVEDILQSIKKLCSLPSRRDYFFQLDKSKGAVDLFEIKDPNIGPEKFDGPNVTDNFARPRIICRPQFEAFLRREICGAGKEAAKEAKRKYRCPYCFMLSLYRDNIERHIQSRKGYSVWRGPACIVRRHKEPNPSGIYESKWPCPKRTPIIEIDCNDILILIYSQLGIRIPGNCLREKKGSKFVRLDS